MYDIMEFVSTAYETTQIQIVFSLKPSMTMKTKASLTLFIALLFVLTTSGQHEKSYDSVVVFQKNYKKQRYDVNLAGMNNISIKQKKPRRDTYPAGEILEDIGRVGLSLLMNAVWGEYTGTSLDDTDEVDWVLSSQIKCPDNAYNWELQVFTKGVHYKEFYAAGTDIGSNSDREVWWDENTTGILLHQKDTISRFVLLVNPDVDEIIQKMAPENFEEIKVQMMRELMSTFDQGGLFLWDMNFAVIGNFRGENFAAVSSEEAGKFWIFKNGIVQAIFQLPEKLVFTPTKKSEERHLLIAKSAHINQFDYLRLSMLYSYFSSNYE